MATDSIHDSRFPVNSKPTNWRDIDVSMPKGLRQLDLEIGRRIGLKNIKAGQLYDYTHEVYVGNINGGQKMYSQYLLPHYTTDLNTAIKLVEHCAALFRLDSAAPGMWRAWFSPMGTMKNAHTPALAICYAFLDWMERAGLPDDTDARQQADESGVE